MKNCRKVSIEQRKFSGISGILSRVKVRQIHIIPINKIMRTNSLKLQLKNQILAFSQEKPRAKYKNLHYIWTQVNSPKYGAQIVELGYGIPNNDGYFVLTGSCLWN